MGALSQAFYDRMANDATLTSGSGLATYGLAPAIFTRDPVPQDATLPYILMDGETLHDPFDTKTTLGHDLTRDIRVFAEATGSTEVVETLAERIRQLFHRYALPVTGFTKTLLAEAFGPIELPSDGTVYGREISVRLVLME